MKKPVQLKATHTYGIVYTDENGNHRIHNMIFKDTDLPAEAVRNAMMSDPEKYYYISVYESDCESGEPVIERSRADQVMHVTVRGPEKEGTHMVTKQKLTLTQDNLLQIEVLDESDGIVVSRSLEIKSEIH